MYREVPASEAKRRFPELLRAVKAGESVIVTSHGKPVARITPVSADKSTSAKSPSLLFARLRRQRTVQTGRWTRAELYDDGM